MGECRECREARASDWNWQTTGKAVKIQFRLPFVPLYVFVARGLSPMPSQFRGSNERVRCSQQRRQAKSGGKFTKIQRQQQQLMTKYICRYDIQNTTESVCVCVFIVFFPIIIIDNILDSLKTWPCAKIISSLTSSRSSLWKLQFYL